MNNKKKKNEDAGILSWIVIVILMSFLWPVGVFFLLSKFFGRDLLVRFLSTLLNNSQSASPDAMRSSTHRTGSPYTTNSSSQNRVNQTATPSTGGQVDWERVRAAQAQREAQAAANAKAEAERRASAAAQAEEKRKQAAAAGKPAAEKPDDGIAHISKGKKALFIFGWILIAAGLIGGISAIGGGTVWSVLRFIAVMLCGGGMLFTARTKDKKERLYQNCVKFIGNKPAIDLNALARAAGVKPKKLEREIDEMLERGYFPAAAYYDNEHDVLVLDPEKAGEIAPAMKTETAPSGQEGDRFDTLLQELEQTCGRIQDREMLEKTVQIRGLTAAIFHAVRENPEKEDQISNFLSYYFPTTLKLLDSYADFEEKGYQGEKLQQTKSRIESTADTIIAAYQKQLDHLYLPDTLDVDTDIDVLETMLKRDGLSEDDFGQTGMPGTMN